MGEEFVIIATPSDHMCRKCVSLLNHMDKMENDLKLVKNALLSFIHKKYGLLPTVSPANSINVSYILINFISPLSFFIYFKG